MNKKPLLIRLLQHGIISTGGARYEDTFLQLIENEFSHSNTGVSIDKKVFGRIYRSWQNIGLLVNGFLYSKADVNIVVARLAVSSIIRNLFTKNKTIIILHNFDKNDGKGRMLELYYKVLFRLLKMKPRHVCIVTVAPFFETFFKKSFPGLPVFMIPNLFETEPYRKIHSEKDSHKIFLGQYSSKNDPVVFDLAKMLSETGYYCFFCSLYAGDVAKNKYYDVIHVPFETYLQEMASSCCTIAFTGVLEGWNRVAHESILVHTPVIGFDRGGLGDLLRETGSYIVSDATEAYELITALKPGLTVSEDFYKKYDIKNFRSLIKPLLDFIKL